jgi:hypothetical protein
VKQKTFELDQFANTEKLISKELAEVEKKQERLRHAISAATQTAKSIAIRRDALVRIPLSHLHHNPCPKLHYFHH